MNAAHWHLVLTHIPVLLTIFSIPIFFWGVIKKNEHFRNAAFLGFIIAGLLVYVVVRTGHASERIVRDLPGVTRSAIHEHEEAAEFTMWLSIVLGIASIAGWYLQRSKSAFLSIYLWILLIYSLAVGGAFFRTAYLGGYIRHTEITTSNSPATQPGALEDDMDGD